MAVDSVGNPGSSLGAAISQAGSNQKVDKQDFLKLLVTQLTNQDPLAPMDQQQFLAQLAQFSTVEGIDNVQQSQSQQQATNLLGRTVDAYVVRDNLPVAVSGVVNSVRWDASGIHLSVQGSTQELTMDEISSVR